MSRTAGRGLQPLEWLVMPLVAAILATVLLAAPLRVLGLALPEPVFPLAPAFAWAVIRPSILAPVLLLAAGLFLDLFWSGPLGLWPTALLLGYGMAFAARTLMLGQSPGVVVAWWVTVVLAAFTTAYLAAMIDSHVAPNLVAAGLQFGFTVALYPLARLLIDRFEDADTRFR